MKINMSNQYREKPVTISAVQYTGENKKEIHDFTNGTATVVLNQDPITLENGKQAEIGDWIVRGQQGCHYSMQNDSFHKMYELVE